MTQHDKESNTPTKKLIKRGAPLLLWTMLASILIHMTPMLTLISMDLRLDTKTDFKWFGQMSDLQHLGHGADRWAKIQTMPKPKSPEDKQTKKEKTKPDDLPKTELANKKEDPKPVKKQKKKPQKPPKKKTKKRIVKKAPKKPKKVITSIAKKTPAPKKTKPTKNDKKDNTQTAPKAPALPGLQNAGPSNLPNFKNYAPGNARMMALVRLRKVRNTPLEQSVKTLLRAVPDYRILLEGQKHFDPVKKLDAIFMASANPRYLQKTFLAIRHRMPKQEVKQTLGARFETAPEWGSYRGYPIRPLVPTTSAYKDPRRLMLATSRLALVTRPEWLKQLTTKPTPDPNMSEEDAAAQALPMINGLNRIEKAATSSNNIVLVSAQGLRFYFPGYGTLPNFQTVRLAVDNVRHPKVTIDLQFTDKRQAQNFTQSCPKLKKGLIGAIPGAKFLGLDTYVNKLSCKHTETYVTVTGTYTQKEVLRAISLITPFIPRPPALDKMPKPPTQPEKPDTPETPNAKSNTPQSTTKTDTKTNVKTNTDPKQPQTKPPQSPKDPTTPKTIPTPNINKQTTPSTKPTKPFAIPSLGNLKSMINKGTKTDQKTKKDNKNTENNKKPSPKGPPKPKDLPKEIKPTPAK